MLTINTQYSSIQKKTGDFIQKKLFPLQKQLKKVVQEKSYSTVYSFLNIPSDTALLKLVKNRAKQYEGCSAIVIIGIGGSNLGAKAVHEAIQGLFWNDLQRGPKVFFADTVDPQSTGDIYNEVESLLYHEKNVLLNIITKSGTTVETLANAHVFVNLLAKKRKDWKQWVVITTDKESALWSVAKQWQCGVLEIPKMVGGRFSVFSAAGLFPLAVLGVNIDALLAGAMHMRSLCLGEKSPAMQSAAHLYAHLKKKRIHDTWLFSTCLESVGKWYRQLLAESLGKEFNRKGKRVHAGITPTVNIGTTDLHSMVQLCLGGPEDKFTTFVTVDNEEDRIIPQVPQLSSIVPGLAGKGFKHIRKVIEKSVMQAYQKRNLPYIHIALAQRNEESIGAFLQLKMLEVIFLGTLLDVNVFDEPNVEEYKRIARKALGSSNRK